MPAAIVGSRGTKTSAGSTCSAAAARPGRPRRQVHDRVGGTQDHRQHQRIHAEPAIDRQERGDRDQRRGRAVAVERHDQRDDRGAQRHAHRVFAGEAQHAVDQRIEQAGIDHQREIEHGEQQQRGGRRQLRDAVDRHLAQIGTVAGKHAEQDRYQDQRDQRGQPAAS
jgi:hypothetical protein